MKIIHIIQEYNDFTNDEFRKWIFNIIKNKEFYEKDLKDELKEFLDEPVDNIEITQTTSGSKLIITIQIETDKSEKQQSEQIQEFFDTYFW